METLIKSVGLSGLVLVCVACLETIAPRQYVDKPDVGIEMPPSKAGQQSSSSPQGGVQGGRTTQSGGLDPQTSAGGMQSSLGGHGAGLPMTGGASSQIAGRSSLPAAGNVVGGDSAGDSRSELGGGSGFGGLPDPGGLSFSGGVSEQGGMNGQGGDASVGGQPAEEGGFGMAGSGQQPEMPRCHDGLQNEAESDVDCGGPVCPPCAIGLLCSQNADCVSGACRASVCRPAACDDAVVNGVETDVDCGGEQCEPCQVGLGCRAGSDCVDGVCQNGLCAEPRCGDGVRNGMEQCDDGNQVDGDDCRADCTTPSCGNGVIDPGEGSCDCGPGLVNLDGNSANGCECGVLANVDVSCDGIDDDCDGRVDEDSRSPDAIRGECGQFDGPCDRSGVSQVTRRECDNGSVVEVVVPDICVRDTDGVEVRTGEWSACEGFEGVCGEDGRRSRDRIVCRNGVETNEPESEMCTRETNGVIADLGDWGECAGFIDECDESGTQTRQISRCEAGNILVSQEEQACPRQTDGNVIVQGGWGACSPDPDDPCDYSGRQTRENTVCQNGMTRQTIENRECMYASDGDVLQVGDWEACGAFANACAEDGRQERTKVICQDQDDNMIRESRACSRDTDDVEIVGAWGECGGFDSVCDENGVQSRTRITCANGNQTVTIQERVCTRDTDGVEVRLGDWGACGDFETICDESGTQSRERSMCQNGNEVNEEVQQGCTRNTDGIEARVEDWGACGNFDDACDESGTRSRSYFVCRMGQEVDEPQSEGCARDTDGQMTRAGDWSDCGGFRSTCDETGTRSRSFFVCRMGQEVDEPESDECTRSTDIQPCIIRGTVGQGLCIQGVCIRDGDIFPR